MARLETFKEEGELREMVFSEVKKVERVLKEDVVTNVKCSRKVNSTETYRAFGESNKRDQMVDGKEEHKVKQDVSEEGNFNLSRLS